MQETAKGIALTIVTHGSVIKSDGDWNPAEKEEGKEEEKTRPLAPLKYGGSQCGTRGGGSYPCS